MYKSDINLNLYKIFYDVSSYGSISKTAKQNYLSQSAVSKAIKKLESDLNTQLFYRKAKGVELTNAGKELLFFVEKSYNNLILAERNMIETENLTRGKLSIGMPSNIGSFFLFEKVIAFHKNYPMVEISIITGSTTKLLELLDCHTVDFVIDSSPINSKDKDLIIVKLDTVNYCFIANSNSDIIENKKIKKLKDLINYPLILPIPGTANRKDLDEVFSNNDLELKNVINIHTSEVILAGVKKDLGVGYLIYDLIKDDNDVEVLDIREKLPTVDINLVYNPNYLTTAPKKFINNYISSNLKL